MNILAYCFLISFVLVTSSCRIATKNNSKLKDVFVKFGTDDEINLSNHFFEESTLRLPTNHKLLLGCRFVEKTDLYDQCELYYQTDDEILKLQRKSLDFKKISAPGFIEILPKSPETLSEVYAFDFGKEGNETLSYWIRATYGSLAQSKDKRTFQLCPVSQYGTSLCKAHIDLENRMVSVKHSNASNELLWFKLPSTSRSIPFKFNCDTYSSGRFVLEEGGSFISKAGEISLRKGAVLTTVNQMEILCGEKRKIPAISFSGEEFQLTLDGVTHRVRYDP